MAQRRVQYVEPVSTPSPLWVIGRVVFLAGAAGFLILSLMSWYVSEFQDENAWAGETSLAAALAMIGALLVAGLSLVGTIPLRPLVWAVLELVGSVACAALTAAYISENVDDIVVRGRIIRSGLQSTTYIALAAAGVMAVGSLLNLIASLVKRD